MTLPDYYDYAPTVALARPVVFAGHAGCAYREVVYDLVSLTGLPLHDLDHLVEHEAGSTLWALARQRGKEALQRLAEGLLDRALASRPPGLVVLGQSMVPDAGRLRRLRATAGLVFLRLPATACYWTLRRQAEERDGILGHPLLPDRLAGPLDLKPLRQRCGPVLAAADLVVDMERRGVHEAVQLLQQALPRLGARPAEGEPTEGSLAQRSRG